jgi:uncharacterized membrane protein (DUF4010 family)
MDLAVVFEKVALALGLGLLVGMQRESVRSQLAGIRTFALITVLGAICSLLSLTFGGWIVALGALAVGALLVAGNLVQRKTRKADPGLTTEMAALVMYALGAYLVVGHAAVALALGGGTAVLLHWKQPLHQFIGRIGQDDFKAIMQFVLIAMVIWPVLPDETFGPYHVLNPHKIWFMVVLIVGISLSGYVVQKWLGAQAGSVIGGVLGGLISSTATTVSYARRASAAETSTNLLALILMIATTTAGARILIEIAVVAPGAFTLLALPLVLHLAWMAGLSAVAYFLAQSEKIELPAHQNPAELMSALIFGGLYALVILAVAAVKDWVGDRGLYVVAILSGLHDLDAITLSTAQLVNEEQLGADLGWRLILVATLSNLTVKTGIVAALGSRSLLYRIALLFGAALLGGLALLMLWPSGD